MGSITNIWSDTANGVNLAYGYDILGRMTNVLDNGNAAAVYGFDAVGNLQSLSYGNGVTNLYQYDSMNRLINQVCKKADGTTLASFGYTLGPTGNRMTLTETVNNNTQRTYNWAYDYLYRLTGETIGNTGTVNYNFDGEGNRTSRTSSVSGINGQTASFTLNDWLASDTHDNNGNTTVSGSSIYQYDALNHLTNVNNGQILISYDGDGNRASKKVGGTTTYYLVDDRNPSGYAQVLEEWTSAGTPALNCVYNYGLALISQRQVSSGTVSYYGYDGHGSTRFLLNTSGSITDTYAYDAYGLQTTSTGTTPNSYLYCGQQWDSDLGLYYNRARYLNPNTGRFWTMDTYEGNNEDPLSLHKYVYGTDDPVNLVDPSGHDGGCAVGVAYLARIVAALAGKTSLTENTESGATVQVDDIFINVRMNLLYTRIDAELPNEMLHYTSWYRTMQGAAMDIIDQRARNNLTYVYTGTEYPELQGTAMSAHELNYMGVGAGFAASGFPLIAANTVMHKYYVKRHKVNPSTNVYTAFKAGFNAYEIYKRSGQNIPDYCLIASAGYY